MKKLQNNEYYEGNNYMMAQEIDIDREIERVINTLNDLKITYEWTKGYINKATEMDEFKTTINTCVDSLATKARDKSKRYEIETTPYPFFPGSIAALMIDQEMIHNNVKQIIVEYRDGDTLKNS